MPSNFHHAVAPDAPERLAKRTKVYTIKFRMEGELVVTAADQAEAYRLALLWSDNDLAEVANLEMDDPVERGDVQ
jgi:hypothetical protein